MAWDFLKKKTEEKVLPEKAEAKSVPEPKKTQPVSGNKKNGRTEILLSPHVTEKAASQDPAQSVFKVDPMANKTEIKKAIESLYHVDVIKVRIINVPKKRRKLGRYQGWKSGYKKALVEIKEGQKIEIGA